MQALPRPESPTLPQAGGDCCATNRPSVHQSATHRPGPAERWSVPELFAVPVAFGVCLDFDVAVNRGAAGEAKFVLLVAKAFPEEQWSGEDANLLKYSAEPTLVAVLGTLADGHVARSALAKPATIHNFVRPAVKLDAVSQGHLPQVFTRFRFDRLLLVDELDLRHVLVLLASKCREQAEIVNRPAPVFHPFSGFAKWLVDRENRTNSAFDSADAGHVE